MYCKPAIELRLARLPRPAGGNREDVCTRVGAAEAEAADARVASRAATATSGKNGDENHENWRFHPEKMVKS
jgi:hypothetical protein